MPWGCPNRHCLAGRGKIPVTTASAAAKNGSCRGRELAEKLQAQDSIQHFDKAISLDPNFALAELSRANAAPSPKDFFEHLHKAVALSAKASDGEKFAHSRHRGGRER